MLHRKLFYDAIRESLFGRKILESQQEGIHVILENWEATYPTSDLRWLAYALGTTHHECMEDGVATMQPIEETGRGAGRWYDKPDPETGFVYYGRGFVQLTHKANYEKAGEKLGIDLVHEPALALQPDIAAKILLRGMTEGWFTGARFDWYFNDKREDWINARRIVNALIRAELVAGYSKLYFDALT